MANQYSYGYPIVVDVSNYDYDADVDEPQWAKEFVEAGIGGIIVGSQWPTKAAAQLESAKVAGLTIIGTYAEPDAVSAIELAREYGGGVGLACERGSILTHEELAQDITAVYNAHLTPWVYGNQSDLAYIAGNFCYTEKVWLANYGRDDPTNPREPILSVNFGQGEVKLFAHQFSSTIIVAGRNRDHSYWYAQGAEAMSSAEYNRVIRILTGFDADTPQAEEQLSAWETKGNSLLLGYGIEQADQDKLEASSENLATAVKKLSGKES